MLTANSEIKTWNTSTGKLISCERLAENRFKGFKKMNFFRNRTIIYRQIPGTAKYEYLCVEIISGKKIAEYAKLVCNDHKIIYMSSNDDLVMMEHHDSKHSVFEILKFNKKTGQIVDAH